ncbi:sigma factor [Kribbella sp. NPDC055110]
MAEASAFAEFATSRHGALFRYAYLLTGDRGLAEDLVQEALVKTYVGWHRLRDPNNAEAYTRRAITTTAIGWWRRKSWRAERPYDEDLTEPPALDLDGIVAAGKHRAGRRRTLGIVGGAVATAAVAVGGATVIRPRNQQPQPARPAPFAQRRPTFALGNEIHYGSEVISVAPYKVTAFVQTDAGFVFLDAGNIHIADRSGVRATGKSAWSLTADHRGNLVAWVEGFDDHVESVVYDVAAGRELVRTRAGNTIPPTATLAYDSKIVALDGDTAYFGTPDGLYRWNIRTNQGELMAKGSPVAVRTVTAGQIVYAQPLDQRVPTVNLAIATTVSATAPARFSGQQAFLSPAAKYLFTETDDALIGIEPGWVSPRLYDVATARQIGLPYAYDSLFFGQWLDDDSFVAAGKRRFSKTAETDLLVVTAATGAVKVAVPNFAKLIFSTTPPRIAPFALPTGGRIIDL